MAGGANAQVAHPTYKLHNLYMKMSIKKNLGFGIYRMHCVMPKYRGKLSDVSIIYQSFYFLSTNVARLLSPIGSSVTIRV